MPELRSRARDSDFSLIDLPRTESIDDLPAYLQAALRWHFSPETGSPYRLKRAKALDFNSLTDVTTFEDLALFPNVVDAQLFLPSHATDFKNAEVRPYLNNYSGNHEAIRIEILVAQDALGLTETYRQFAAACLNEYDLDGWTVPDLVNHDGGNSSANPTTDCAERNHGASTPHTEPIRRAAQTNRVRIKRPTLRRRSDSRLTTRSDVVRQKECGEPLNKGVHPS
ncbi:MAG TPA: hypothetical protein VGO30_04910 [Mycobacterium sp.]|jgi:hypothetical protein|nr:hypothetical protein [Mycobacterium sp.]